MRSRKLYIVLIISTILLGLASRKFPEYFPVFLANYLGDSLWAMLVFWVLGFTLIHQTSRKLAFAALSFSYLIEISQLYHSPWIDTIRSNSIGALVLGHGFLWTDLICYTAGILIGYLLEISILAKK